MFKRSISWICMFLMVMATLAMVGCGGAGDGGFSQEGLNNEGVADSSTVAVTDAVTDMTSEGPVEPKTEADLAAEALVEPEVVALAYTYPAPILQSVQLNGTSYVLTWTQSGKRAPLGGYDLIIDGVDTEDADRTTNLSAVVSGLTAGVEHCFQVQGRFIQANPDQSPVSNKVCVSPTAPAPAPTPTPAPEPVPAPSTEPGSVRFGASTYSVAEGAVKLDVVFERVGGSYGPLNVEWRTRTFDGYGTADWSTDYGTFLWAPVTFANGETRKVLSVTINQDTVVEGSEWFTILLRDPAGGSAASAPTSAVVTLTDDDSAPAPTPTPTPTPEPTPTPTPSTSLAKVGHDKTRGSSDSPSIAANGGTPRYIAPNGANSGSCTNAGAPCATLSYAMGQASAGDTIFMRGGTYNASITWSKSGTSTNPIEIRSYPGEWAVISGKLTVSGASNVRLRNFELMNASLDGVYVQSSNGILFENIYSHNNGASGFGCYQSNNVTWRYCTSKDNYDTISNGGNADGFAISSGNGNIIEYSLSVHNSDDGFDTWQSTNATIRHNVAYQNGWAGGDGTGFKMGGGTNAGTVNIYGNISHSNKNRGFDNNAGTGHRNFYNNVSYNNNTGNLGSANWKIITGTATGRNNISFGTGANLDSLSAMGTRSNSLGGGYGGTVDSSYFESVDFANLNSTTAGSRYFYPKSSALIDRGYNVGLPYSGTVPDIGAREYGL